MKKEPSFTATVNGLERLKNSVNGNPRYRVCFSDHDGMYVTTSDAGFCYGISNPEMRGPVDVWLTKTDRIAHMAPAERPETPGRPKCHERDHNWVVAFDEVGQHDACTRCDEVQR